jgi:hypothetical protein
MPSVAIHPPKSPVTKGSMGIAACTLPNVCKMPGPPAPFVPTPLPNIAKSGDSPDGYSTSVKIEGNYVAIRGASFKSMGDVASKATGGGLLSMNTHGPAKFLTPGSLTVNIEGKGVHLLSEQMLNNHGPSGNPPNTGATMAGLVQVPTPSAGLIAEVGQADAQALCDAACGAKADKAAGKGNRLQSNMRNRLDPKPRGTGGGNAASASSGVLTEVSQGIAPPNSVVGKFGGGATSPGAGTKARWDIVLTNKKPAPNPLSFPGDVKKIVEVKFPPDSLTPNQQAAMSKMTPKPYVMDVDQDCTCP